jgi:hypothetical protein
MADLAITPTQVLPDDDAVFINGTLGATVTTGMALYQDRETTRFYPADANLTQQSSDVVGIAMNGGGPGQGVRVQTDGVVTLGAGAAPVKGVVYVLSATGGGICPVSDLAPGMWRTVIGVGDDLNTISLGIMAFPVLG